MNKQIEDMRGDLIEIFDKEYDKRRLITPHNTAEKLTELGYRKSTDVAREIFEDIESSCVDIFGYFNYLKFVELKKKYNESEGADDEKNN